MRFSNQRLFSYEKALFEDNTLDEVLAHDPSFALTGLGDLRETLYFTEEYYGQLASLHVKESIRGEIDKVWLESKSDRRFDRVLQMPIFVKQERPQRKRDEAGELTDKVTSFHFATIVLYRNDYFPQNGDQVYFRDTMYDLTNVYIDPADFFQQSAFPLYIRTESRISNTDSRNFGDPCASKFTSTSQGGKVLALPGARSAAVMPP